MLAKSFKGADRELNEGAAPYLHGYPDDNCPEQSPYYWWFQYLKRHEGYRICCEKGGKGKYSKLFRDWGDVRTNDFDEWFFEYAHALFREPDVPDTLSEVKHVSELGNVNWDSVMVVVCPIQIGTRTLSKRAIKAQFADMVDAKFPSRNRGRPEFKSAATYRVQGYPNLQKLGEFLAVYDLKKAEPNLRLWQIGERLHREKKFASGPHHVTNGSDTKAEARDKKKIMTVLVSRHMKFAKELIASSVGSEFPVRNKTQSALNLD